ncbi:DUF4097 family beta strand repeat-containing protein [Micromonospora sp. WMMD1082]|uniref:DUF4097 family beta strand repeat-containing protein n=1 Tax=Micromonospora sp. WMMD1082 TaxID=3016104 RepID=UPI002417EA37|nr:DUF4097 family beta strand repeat-containing protein [Micromonospora sp. WMMD1082]MDG4796156.1 DUF4097 family beta strand repeat-containing protein [Micromonospora sp. WMMD1082]
MASYRTTVTPRANATGRRAGLALAATTALIVLVGCDNVAFRRLDFDTTEAARITAIRVLPGSGDVVVRADGGVDGVRIKRVVRYQGDEPGTTYEIKDAELVLSTSCGHRCSVSYEVTAGEGVSVQGETRSGDIDLSRVGQVGLKLASGNIRVAGATGPVQVETASGNISVYDVASPITLRAASGNVTGTRLGGEVDAEAKSGNVTLELDRPASVRARAASGNVKLTVPDGAYQVRSEVGSGRTQLGVAHDASAELLLDLRTASGDITVTAQ